MTGEDRDMSALVVSPELAMVDGELRRLALEELPAQQPFAFLEFQKAPRRHQDLETFAFLAEHGDAETFARPPHLVLAAVAYASDALVRFALVAVPVVAGLALLVAVLAALR
jgi:hypothetical protein